MGALEQRMRSVLRYGLWLSMNVCVACQAPRESGDGFTDVFGNEVPGDAIAVTLDEEVAYTAAADLADGRIVIYGATIELVDQTIGFPRLGFVVDVVSGEARRITPPAGAPSADSDPALFHVALLDGAKVLVVDVPNLGVSWSGIYDADTDSWTELPTPDLRGERFVRLQDGDVLWTRGPGETARFDTESRTWADVSDTMTEGAAVNGLAATLDDGSVLVVGISGRDYRDPPAAWTFDPGSETWTPRSPPPTRRSSAAAGLLPDGRVIRAGGELDDEDALTATTELYDPVTDTWSTGPMLGGPRKGITLVPVTEGLLAMGGFSRTECPADVRAGATDRSCLTTAVDMLSADGSSVSAVAPMPLGTQPPLVLTDRDPMLLITSTDVLRYRP